MVARGGGAVNLRAAPLPAAAMEWEEARAFAFVLMVASGKPAGQIWCELRQAQGFAGRRRRPDPPFGQVLDALAALVLSAQVPGAGQDDEFAILVALYRPAMVAP